MKIPELQEILICPKKYNPKYLSKHYFEFYNYVNNNFNGDSFSEKMYQYFYGGHVCPLCGKPTIFEGFIKGYRKYCSLKCARNDVHVKEKTKQTNLERYGGVGTASEIIKNKIKQTNLKKYGVENPFQSNTIKEKIKQTNLEKYGVDNVSRSDLIKKKKIITYQQHYGVKYISQSKEIQEKVKQSNLERYGGAGMASSIIKNKIKQTCIKKYGGFTLQSDILKEKVKRTNLKKYGVEYASQSNEVKEKVKQTNLKKYGVEYASQSNEVKEKVKQTNREKYGVEYPTQNENIKQKVTQTNLERYGGFTLQSDILKEKVKQTNLKKYGVEYASQNEKIKNKISKSNKISQNNPVVKEKYKQTCIKKYGTKHPSQNENIKQKISNVLKNHYISEKEYLIGYTEDKHWICKCPHVNNCDKCIEKFYITDCTTYHNRLNLHNELCTKLFPIGSKENGISNGSQIYFDRLNKYFPDSIYYKKSGYEYKISKYSLDYYIPSEQLCIEYNGTYWHAKPTIYKHNDILNIYGTPRTVQEIWDHDKKRKEYIESHGIKVITIWEDDLPDPKKLVHIIKYSEPPCI